MKSGLSFYLRCEHEGVQEHEKDEHIVESSDCRCVYPFLAIVVQLQQPNKPEDKRVMLAMGLVPEALLTFRCPQYDI